MTKIRLTADMLAPPNPYARLKLTHPKVKELAERYAKWKGIKVDDITFYKAARDDFERYVLGGEGRMKHLGDITKINGAEAPVVNVIIGGSPCQDLSLAGKRKGLTGERSGLFMEQLRIIKEMREADEARGRTDEHIRPRFMVWENVPGAFSTNGGKDFGAVLHETVKIACHNAPPVPMFGNKWAKSGCLVDVDGKWSIAWRVFDAQFWGVPQRRRRIALVADFGGLSAPEILFERKSMSRNFEESGTAWKRATTDFEKRTEATVFGICSKDSNSMKSENPKSGFYEADVTRTLDCNGGNPSCNQGGMVVVQSRVPSIDGGETEPIRRAVHGNLPIVAVRGDE